jgi:hypothetical protein
MSIPSTQISVTTPVGLAYYRAKRMLFQPFDLSKWFLIGFCAWLAGLGESGGGSFTGNVNLGGGGGGHPGRAQSFREFADQAANYIAQNLYWIIPLAVALLILSLAVWLVLTWLSSRGKFMFLHYIGTVVLLPVLVFERSYSICYLAQYGPAYDVFPAFVPVAPAAPSGEPKP